MAKHWSLFQLALKPKELFKKRTDRTLEAVISSYFQPNFNLQIIHEIQKQKNLLLFYNIIIFQFNYINYYYYFLSLSLSRVQLKSKQKNQIIYMILQKHASSYLLAFIYANYSSLNATFYFQSFYKKYLSKYANNVKCTLKFMQKQARS